MELMFVVMGGILVASGIRYLFPHRSSYGVLLLPALGGAVSAVVWAALTWLGWKFDGSWIWVVSLALPVVAAVLVAVLVPRRRDAADEVLLQSLSKA
jgi:quaternary ammonium compound-resistance protein SugE